MQFPKFLTLLLLIGTSLSARMVHSSSFFQRMERSHGCGPNPLLEIVNALILKHQMKAEDILQLLDQDVIRDEVLAIVMAFEDCIRTADGQRYRKSQQSNFWILMTAYIKKYQKFYNRSGSWLKTN
ncbi:hypothetical protein TNIN_223561 [Trichonephila inaurata madagascariensis]|uniref:Uncharacterized protein n=1 Tax=Trichonephila inaurata madagascariensis TaxID=2747483 RepID=A0A8X6JA13_9ARAC|nr:hypothetical protein TNIN_223561 [Trichonephila inaurata madagascariensis]